MNKSKAAIVISSIVEKLQLLAGILLLLLFGLLTIGSLADAKLASGGFLPFCIVVDLIGIALIYFSRKRHRLIADFKKYVTILSNSANGSIAALAASTGTSEDIVRKNVENMIKKKYFAAASIDQLSGQILFAQKEISQPSAASPNQPEKITVICKSCGGINTLSKGQTAECEYCGSSIQGS